MERQHVAAGNTRIAQLREMSGDERTDAIAAWTLQIARSLGYDDHTMHDYFTTDAADRLIERTWADDRIYVEGPRVRAAIRRRLEH